ncbi:MAG: hypothetical protein JRJ25_06070 [Deltaproteobacteria bacterium]|nr:hypothetical protein [Deltaproteobacteria bacterium]
MYFYPYGPFKIDKKSNGLIQATNEHFKNFWKAIDEEYTSLSQACGCYIFATKAGKGITPWYIGKAEKQPFAKECFQPHKINHYNEAIAHKAVTPLLFLLPKSTENDNYSKPSVNGHQDVSILETMLIGIAIEKNPSLLNIKGTKIFKEMVVPGVLNSPQGKPDITVLALKQALGVRPKKANQSVEQTA